MGHGIGHYSSGYGRHSGYGGHHGYRYGHYGLHHSIHHGLGLYGYGGYYGGGLYYGSSYYDYLPTTTVIYASGPVIDDVYDEPVAEYDEPVDEQEPKPKADDGERATEEPQPSIPDGVPASVPLVETREAPEALPPADQNPSPTDKNHKH